jgi:predicted HicB family RNase H-like nuclease
MRAAAREFFTVDLRGLRAALTSRAASQGVTESDVLRSALAATLDSGAIVQSRENDESHAEGSVKLSVRLPRRVVQRLDHQARAAGLSRGAYLSRLIDGAPPVTASADRAAGAAALSASAAELAQLSRDINHLTQLLRRGAVEAARPYRERLDTLDADVRAHLDQAALTLALLSSSRAGGVPAGAFKPRSRT